MASLQYDQIYSNFLDKVTDFDIAAMGQSSAYSLMRGWLKNAMSKPHLRRCFKAVSYDDVNQIMEYEISDRFSKKDESENEDFAIESIALGMKVEWLEPQVNSRLINDQFVSSSKESKFYSQAQHMTSIRESYSLAKKVQRDFIRDRGYFKGGN